MLLNTKIKKANYLMILIMKVQKELNQVKKRK